VNYRVLKFLSHGLNRHLSHFVLIVDLISCNVALLLKLNVALVKVVQLVAPHHGVDARLVRQVILLQLSDCESLLSAQGTQPVSHLDLVLLAIDVKIWAAIKSGNCHLQSLTLLLKPLLHLHLSFSCLFIEHQVFTV